MGRMSVSFARQGFPQYLLEVETTKVYLKAVLLRMF